MNSEQVRQSFLDFFRAKSHLIVDSAPMVVKNDPSLMFTNAGMNQFKDCFLGNQLPPQKRVADTQKCLRVSGKHNDLEEVGHDTYHHTMFEMLGNWSFGDYFKKEAIQWAFEYLVDVLKIGSKDMYATYFEGDDEVAVDDEAKKYWESYLPADHVLKGNKKDNFWEMGDVGPCGPCSELHIDLRPEAEKAQQSGASLVNQDHPQVIELWNLVFIQYNRRKDGSLQDLPDKHVDTGMGFERLCRVLQGKNSNYDIDLFRHIINTLEKLSGKQYGATEKTDIAMRVVVDHLRTVAFSVADGQLPSNNKAGYVIRRILRRAVRYGYAFLDFDEPFICNLVPALVEVMGKAFPEIAKQQDLIQKVIREEEQSFIRTLAKGISLSEKLMAEAKTKNETEISGYKVFELYDTFGFPFDLSELIFKEKGFTINVADFEKELAKQKLRSKHSAEQDVSDWEVVQEDDIEEFIGYETTHSSVKITRYRTVALKKGTQYHLVFNYTPFYAEGGGQVGDTGVLFNNTERISIKNTVSENGVIIHIADKLPKNIGMDFTAEVDAKRREKITQNHTATHLLHEALREVLGNHVEQKGSLVNDEHLRFDFSHFEKLTIDQLFQVQYAVNQKVRQCIPLEEHRTMPMKRAVEMGAKALFGEKYGEVVRVIQFDTSIELCGGTHAKNTGAIGNLIIVSEQSIAAGIRRIVAVTGEKVGELFKEHVESVKRLQTLLSTKDIENAVGDLLQKNQQLTKKIETIERHQARKVKEELKRNIVTHNGVNLIAQTVDVAGSGMLKDMAFELKGEIEDLVLILGANIEEKVHLSVSIADNIVKSHNLHAGKMIKEVASLIKGGGGGQPFYATAGGKNPDGLHEAIETLKAGL